MVIQPIVQLHTHTVQPSQYGQDSTNFEGLGPESCLHLNQDAECPTLCS